MTVEIDCSTHRAPIEALSIDEAGRYLVTCDERGEVRLWDLLSRALLARMSAGTAMVAPDGKSIFLLKGGRAVRIDRRDGSVLGWIPDRGDVLACSSGGDYLATYFGNRRDGNTCVYDARSGTVLGKTYSPHADGSDLRAALWTRWMEGNLDARDRDARYRPPRIAMDRTGRLLLWRLASVTLKTRQGRTLGEVLAPSLITCAGISQDGRMVALGHRRRPFDKGALLEVRSGRDLSPWYEVPTGDIGEVGALALSPDGRLLYVADRSGGFIRCYKDAGRGAHTDLPIPGGRVTRLLAWPDGGVVFATDGPAWGALSENGSLWHHVPCPVARPRPGDVLFDPEGTRLRLRLEPGGPALRLSLADQSLAPEATPDASIRVPFTDLRRCTRATADRLLAGSVGGARHCARVSGDRIVITPAQDKLAYGYREARYQHGDGDLLLSLLFGAEGAWVAWNEAGYYAAGGGGEDHVGHAEVRDEALNEAVAEPRPGWQPAVDASLFVDFYPLSRFAAHRRRPELLLDALRTCQAPAAEVELAKLVPPRVRVISPAPAEVVRGATLHLRVRVRTLSDHPVRRLSASIGATTVEIAGPALRDTFRTDGRAKADEEVHELLLPLPPEDFHVSVRAENDHGESSPAMVFLRRGTGGQAAGPGPAAQRTSARRPRLWLLSIGVSAYAQSRLELSFAARDAQALAEAFLGQEGGLFERVSTRLLLDGQVTQQSVLGALEWLQGEVAAADLAIVFLAGHGMNDPATGRYYFLPHDADPDAIRRTMVAGSAIAETLADLPGKRILLLDTCHAGNVYPGEGFRDVAMSPQGFVQDLVAAESSIVVFTASKGAQVSQESPAWGHGAFTTALLDGLSGKADPRRTGRVTVTDLEAYVSDRVRTLTGGRQTPTTVRPVAMQDFPLALCR